MDQDKACNDHESTVKTIDHEHGMSREYQKQHDTGVDVNLEKGVVSQFEQKINRLLVKLEDKEAQLAAKDRTIQQKDAEISRLQQAVKEDLNINDSTSDSTSEADEDERKDTIAGNNPISSHHDVAKKTRFSPQNYCPTLKWAKKKCDDIPLPAKPYPLQAVQTDDDIFIGNTRLIIARYSLHTGSWRENLPHYDFIRFGMVAMNNQLVLIGGAHQLNYKPTGKLRVWKDDLKQWEYRPANFPDMPTPRFQVSATAYQKWLVVAGGRVLDNDPKSVSIVEILDTSTKQWYKAASLPSNSSSMSSATNGNIWYLLGGFISKSELSRNVFSVYLDELIPQAGAKSAAGSPWQILPKTPLEKSCAVVFKGLLLSVGGIDSSAICYYHQESGTWINYADLHTRRSQCACAVFPDGRLFVAGGLEYTKEGEVATNRVDIATFNYTYRDD